MSSVAGLVPAPGFGYYSATKFAVEAVTDALHDEVAAQGISVLTVEPGAFRTNAYAGFADDAVEEAIPVYHEMLEQVRAVFVGMDGVQPGDPHRGGDGAQRVGAGDGRRRRQRAAGLVAGGGGQDRVHLVGLLQHPQRLRGHPAGPQRLRAAAQPGRDLLAHAGPVPGHAQVGQRRGGGPHLAAQLPFGLVQRHVLGDRAGVGVHRRPARRHPAHRVDRGRPDPDDRAGRDRGARGDRSVRKVCSL